MLIIFDIDGTLCDTLDVDARCCLEAIEHVMGRTLATVDWTAYPEATNAAIVQDFLRDCGEREIEALERRIREEFVLRLEDAGRRDPTLFRPMDGALDMIDCLGRKKYDIAIATGCWHESAHAKLRLSGFDVTRIPFASSSDARRRVDIISLAAARAGCVLSDSIYVGDGVWDVKAARELGMGFIGVGRKHELLRQHGARRVFESFRDTDTFLDALHNGY
jgi:phosphoglycolate phosphatase-like HAD superfamily hydrolase